MKKILFILFLAGCTKTNTELVKQVVTDTVTDTLILQPKAPPKVVDSFVVEFVGTVYQGTYGVSPAEGGSEITLEAGIQKMQPGDSIASYQFTQFWDSTYTSTVSDAFFASVDPGEADNWFGYANYCMALCENQILQKGYTYYYEVSVTDKFGNIVTVKTQIYCP